MNHNRILLGIATVLALALPLTFLGQSAFGLGQDKDSAEEARQIFQQAQEMAKAQKFDQAIDTLKKALKLVPNNDQYLAHLSHFELKAGRYADGMEHALQALRLNDKVGAYYILVAGNAFGLQDVDRALDYCERVLKGGPRVYGPEPCKDATLLKDQLAKKTYTLFWTLDPSKGRALGGTVAVALPKDRLPSQSATFEIKGAKRHRVFKGYVNDIIQIFPQVTNEITLTTR
jgi:tetratricopeptide (TPR) repeat protein